MKRALIPILILAAPLAAAAAPPAHEGAADNRALVWKVVNFAILAGALGYVIRKKGGVFFAARTESIRRELEEAARLHAEAQARYAEMELRLANIGTEIESLRARASEESGAQGERARAEAQDDLRRIHARAEQEIAAAVKAARQELRVYSAELAVGLAEGKIRGRLTPESESAMVGFMLKDLETRTDAPARAS